MTTELVTPDDDDGFSSAPSFSGRGSNFLKWTAADHWVDRDGVPAPSPLLVLKISELLRRWEDNKPVDITTKPLPLADDLNAAIPQEQWEKGIDGKARPPWAHHVVFYLVNPATGAKYVYAAATAGAHAAYDILKEETETMRLLRGERVIPLAELQRRPFRSRFNPNMERPHLEPISWHLLGGGGGGSVLAPPSTPQISGPAAVDPAPSTKTANSITSGPQPKAPIKLAAGTLEAMGDVKPVTTAEILDDDLPY